MKACLARKASSEILGHFRQDYPAIDLPEWHKWITIKQIDGAARIGDLSLDFHGDLNDNYEKHNADYRGLFKKKRVQPAKKKDETMDVEKPVQPDLGRKYYAFPNNPTPSMPVVFDETKCTGCNKCVIICTTDVLVTNPERGKPPIIMYPEECWYAGCCVAECPVPGAITMRLPLMSRVHFKNKETGEIRRV